ncbi:MAG: tRNA epoxyqueuosine(34) reductase QueG [Cyanobacteria bacterium]|nr:tRNA epoxyqueuosine(34) reductase QueG [Cyanobacteriota bacterium]
MPEIPEKRNNNLDDQLNLSAFIKEKALSLGFSRVGILSGEVMTETLEEASHGFESWLDQGHHGDMAWMEGHLSLRKDPNTVLEGVQSIVCVLLNYFPGRHQETDSYKVAKYARGKDYHLLIREKLRILLKEIQKVAPEVQGRPVTDSAPLHEKPLAVRSGLGWVGKNGNLISPQHGSWFFLGELLLNVPLESDFGSTNPQNRALKDKTNLCGTCTRCIDACPTEAILTNGNNIGVIDATRCISYWTIEAKASEFPVHIQKNLSGWAYGCDICQDVCPWNLKFETMTTEMGFLNPQTPASLDPDKILEMSQDTFQNQFKETPIKRLGLSGLQRNVRALMPE